jgi:hypothetical protein
MSVRSIQNSVKKTLGFEATGDYEESKFEPKSVTNKGLKFIKPKLT